MSRLASLREEDSDNLTRASRSLEECVALFEESIQERHCESGVDLHATLYASRLARDASASAIYSLACDFYDLTRSADMRPFIDAAGVARDVERIVDELCDVCAGGLEMHGVTADDLRGMGVGCEIDPAPADEMLPLLQRLSDFSENVKCMASEAADHKAFSIDELAGLRSIADDILLSIEGSYAYCLSGRPHRVQPASSSIEAIRDSQRVERAGNEMRSVISSAKERMRELDPADIHGCGQDGHDANFGLAMFEDVGMKLCAACCDAARAWDEAIVGDVFSIDDGLRRTTSFDAIFSRCIVPSLNALSSAMTAAILKF